MLDDDFYRTIQPDARRSALAIVPPVLNYVQPNSVVDVGGGTGTWAKVFKENGVDEVLVLDGEHINPELLEVQPGEFRVVDITEPLEIERRFDLVVSLETAEHLPVERADVFVRSLTGAGSVILFSAAIPHQGGFGHINEQWQTYWAEKFAEHNFVPIDALRRKIWNNPNVQWWYAQNVLFYVRRDELYDYPLLVKEHEFTTTNQLNLVHPHKYLESLRS